MTDPRRSPDNGVAPDRGEGMPRWLKLTGIIVLILILLVGVMLLVGGGHRPRRHAASGDPGGQTPPFSVTTPRGVPGHRP
jgi:hypothetical protein